MSNSSAIMAASPSYYDGLYRQFRSDPSVLDPSWRILFSLLDELTPEEGVGKTNADNIEDVFRRYGHLAARLDPIAQGRFETFEEFLASKAGEEIVRRLNEPQSSLAAKREQIEHWRRLYCGFLTIETGHIDDNAVLATVQEQFEAEPRQVDADARKRAFDLLVSVEQFERLMSLKFPTKKRFGAEGADAIVPLLDRVLSQAAKAGVKRAVIGTMHRGRLNILANVLDRPLETLFSEITGAHPFAAASQEPADVPYHLAHDAILNFGDSSLAVSLTPNPSHLEAVNPVAMGRARAFGDLAAGPSEVLCILLHTDASVIGQGVVAETLQLGQLDGYSVGGIVHLIINNQIGFTTNQDEARSSRYCTGAWKAVDSPIFHVNGDQIDSVLQAADLAVAFRQSGKRDVIIDLVCYRRNGHNEIDEPRFTQPLQYQVIDEHPPVRDLYQSHLESVGLVDGPTAEELGRLAQAKFSDALARSLNAAKERAPQAANKEPETGAISNSQAAVPGVSLESLTSLLSSLSSIPGDMTVDRKLERLIRQRSAAAEAGVPWALSEALAFGTLLIQGISVRLSGQDVSRGAFSQRHFKLTDIHTGRRHVSLNHLSDGQAKFDIVDSPLSEYAVLGFEYGYSLERPDVLTIWEAQFGDFANGAQVVIDQFIASAAEKWRQQSSMVLLLPHGLEGQGPEHSSARPERYLQLAAGRNFQLAHPSTPANYFHLLRRQAIQQSGMPLIVLSPKQLLRLPAAVSPLAQFDESQEFEPLLVNPATSKTRRIILCSGKLAYDLESERERVAAFDTAILRLEMLFPLPEEQLRAFFATCPEAECVWVQEEPGNYGAWGYLESRLRKLRLRTGAHKPDVECIAREERASPAGSFHGSHDNDQRTLVRQAFEPLPQ